MASLATASEPRAACPPASASPRTFTVPADRLSAQQANAGKPLPSPCLLKVPLLQQLLPHLTTCMRALADAQGKLCPGERAQHTRLEKSSGPEPPPKAADQAVRAEALIREKMSSAMES